MFQDIGGKFEMYTCIFEINIDGRVQRQEMEAPRFMLEQQFINYVAQSAKSSDAVKVKMALEFPIYDQLNNKWINQENSVTFKNLAYMDKYKNDN